MYFLKWGLDNCSNPGVSTDLNEGLNWHRDSVLESLNKSNAETGASFAD